MNIDKNKNSKLFKYALLFIVSGLLINSIYSTFFIEKNTVKISQNYPQVFQDIKNKNVSDLTILEKTSGVRDITVTTKTIEADGKPATYMVTGPRDQQLIDSLVENEIKFHAQAEPEPSFFERFLFSWGPTILFIAVWVWFMRGMLKGNNGGKGLFSIGKSKAQLIDPDSLNVKFADVVGCDEAKLEVQEFVDFLKNPEKFRQLGGNVPRGLLLTGPAGTGKTLLAKALAKESGVPFYAMSGSDFVEMFVGVGASRVRDMFEIAKKASPCVLFIDEVDAIGGKRSSASFGGGGDSEREQTLNQLLVEMDGIDSNANIILVGATNRPESLDPALLRPGRFDRQVVVPLPDVFGRETMLKTHINLKKVPYATTVDLAKIARGTPGFSGAEIANLVNEAAIFAARRNSKFVEQVDFEMAKDKIMMGPERPSLALSEEDKRETAYHEAGHAIIAYLLPNSDPVYKVTIIPRGRALGLTQQLPEKDRFSHKKEYLQNRILILMGGRAAEHVFCDTLTTGASNDIAVATNIARSMVMEWGMSKLGPVAYGTREQSFLGGSGLRANNLSDTTMLTVDSVVEEILRNAGNEAIQMLEKHRDKIEAMTEALMEVETLDDWQIDNIMANRHFNDPQGLKESQEKARKKAEIEIKNRQEKLDKINAKNQVQESKNDSDEVVRPPEDAIIVA